ncbi:acetylcholinesterase-like [Galendromus occidentalis]|uniref:Acetylcholinesterase-like n=1 Tax=Galendromus occidentalis TaxID=34638 RepID=A0AAJ6QQM2_9ACAR|nr:acetylcholinesterase-like [Galendromus occidentalis]
MMRFGLLCYFFVAVTCNPEVTTSRGTIVGVYTRILDVDMESFLSIPYVEPPVGLLRYEKPQEYGLFPELKLNGTAYPPACPQIVGSLAQASNISQSEDCLYLNIFRRRGTNLNDQKAVLVIFHGGLFLQPGGFSHGTSADPHQNPEALVAAGDVILVTFNYRLGVLGFADLKEFAPANLGLHDQRAALAWVKENIGEFGGNANDVTVMGTGAGSMSIVAHIMSFVDNRDFFHTAILDGGVLSSNALLEDTTSSFRRISKIAYDLGCPLNSRDMIECLQDSDLEDLISLSEEYMPANGLAAFVPTADGFIIPTRPDAFIDDNNVLLKKVRLMIGFAEDEGTLFTNYTKSTFNFTEDKTEDEITNYCLKLSDAYNYPLDVRDRLTKDTVKEIYAARHEKWPRRAVVTFQGDGVVKCPTNNFIKQLCRRTSEVFVYHFERKFSKNYLPEMEDLGVFHTSPFQHFVGSLFLYVKPGDMAPEDRRFMLDTMKMITDFVADQESNPRFRDLEWPSFAETGKVLVIRDEPRLRGGLLRRSICDEVFTPPYKTGKVWMKIN